MACQKVQSIELIEQLRLECMQELLSSGYNEQEAASRFVGRSLAGFIQKLYFPESLETQPAPDHTKGY